MSLHAKYPLTDEGWVGMKVMCRSNEDESLVIATFIGFQSYPNFSLPLVEHADGKKWLCMGEIWPYDEDVFIALNELSPEKQYEFMVKVRLMESMLKRGKEIKGKS